MGGSPQSSRRSEFPRELGASIRKRVPILGRCFRSLPLGKFSALFRSAKAGVVGMPRLTFTRHAAIGHDYASTVGAGSGSDWSVSVLAVASTFAAVVCVWRCRQSDLGPWFATQTRMFCQHRTMP